MRFIILIVVLVVAAAAGYFTLQMTAESQAPQQALAMQEPQVKAVNVLVARDMIPVGTVITEEMLDQQPWPKHLLLDGFVVSGTPDSNVVGMVARSDFQAQEPLNNNKLASATDANFIAASLPAGMRALTVAVDAISGVAGYVFPGDRIDVVITHNIPMEIEGIRRMSAARVGFSETLLSDVAVVAVDSRKLPPRTDDKRQPDLKVPTNITLAVSPEDAQKVRLAEKNGSLSLVLRSLKDRENTDSVAPTEISSLVGGANSSTVIIVRGVNVDVSSGSRFVLPPVTPIITPTPAPIPPATDISN